MSTTPLILFQTEFVTVHCSGNPAFFDVTYTELTEDWSDEDVHDFVLELTELARAEKPAWVLFDQTHYHAVLSEENNRLAAEKVTRAFIEYGVKKCAIRLTEDLLARISTRHVTDQSEAEGALSHYPIRFFHTREEALQWLFDEEDEMLP